MQIVGFGHIQLAIPPNEEATARRFYSQVLGLTEVSKPVELVSRGRCWFRVQGVDLHLGAQQDFSPAHKAHLAFLVADLKATR